MHIITNTNTLVVLFKSVALFNEKNVSNYQIKVNWTPTSFGGRLTVFGNNQNNSALLPTIKTTHYVQYPYSGKLSWWGVVRIQQISCDARLTNGNERSSLDNVSIACRQEAASMSDCDNRLQGHPRDDRRGERATEIGRTPAETDHRAGPTLHQDPHIITIQ